MLKKKKVRIFRIELLILLLCIIVGIVFLYPSYVQHLETNEFYQRKKDAKQDLQQNNTVMRVELEYMRKAVKENEKEMISDESTQ